MFLVNSRLKNVEVPDYLPPNIFVEVVNLIYKHYEQTWIVTPDERQRSEAAFRNAAGESAVYITGKTLWYSFCILLICVPFL